ncbi:hypothetical protein [Micromonospora sp. CPCC 206061]|uniref:hypothetical protein n=1 Tax=Micromonospora sp. CPCC 206061 TaxID=3122410 RepID=UPI002FEF7D3F
MEQVVVDPALLDAMLAGASTPGTDQDRWLDSITDQLGAFTDEQAALVTVTLTDLVLAGLPARERESALHAVAEVVEWHPVARPAAEALCTLDRTALSPSEVEYLGFVCG